MKAANFIREIFAAAQNAESTFLNSYSNWVKNVFYSIARAKFKSATPRRKLARAYGASKIFLAANTALSTAAARGKRILSFSTARLYPTHNNHSRLLARICSCSRKVRETRCGNGNSSICNQNVAATAAVAAAYILTLSSSSVYNDGLVMR